MNKRTWMLACAAGLALLAGCAGMGGSAPAPVTDTVARTPQLSTLAKLVGDAGLADTLRGPGPFTVFAPTDEAFKAVPAKTLEELGKDKEKLRAVLGFHVVPAKVMAADVKPGNVKTLNGAEATVAKAGTFVTYDEAVVTQTDIVATNGVIHLVDKVVIPPPPKK
jgi:uncharacterized surface protein with fasciclin (FAS1) repeats